jgi:hypothetical protein
MKKKSNNEIKHQRNFLVTAGYKLTAFTSIATAAVARGHFLQSIRPLA